MLTLGLSASAMSYEQARNEALFLTDKMAYELNLTDAQYEAAYEINLDYLMGVTSQGDVFGTYWERRNMDLSYILYSWQWDAFRAATYFYRPLYWDAGYWHFGIYARYPHRDYFYFGRPHFYATYRGGHSWRLNGGRSYYHGRAEHFRPTLPRGRQHFGMRNGYDRGDFRGSRSGSSTRITGRHGGNDRTYIDNRTYNYNRSVNRNNNYNRSESYNQRNNGRFGRSSEQQNRRIGNSTMQPSRNNSNADRPSRSFGGSSNSVGTRSTGNMNNNRSARSIGSNRSVGSMGSRSAGGPSNVGSRSSSRGTTSNSHGHFGGARH